MINYMKNLLILTGINMILPFTISYGQIEPDPNHKNNKNKDYWCYKVFTPWEHIKKELNIK